MTHKAKELDDMTASTEDLSTYSIVSGSSSVGSKSKGNRRKRTVGSRKRTANRKMIRDILMTVIESVVVGEHFAKEESRSREQSMQSAAKELPPIRRPIVQIALSPLLYTPESFGITPVEVPDAVAKVWNRERSET
jgi:hypothetical protein